MSERAQIIAGRCTTVFQGRETQEQCGDVIVLVKPDGTVLVHDTQGYQPVAWLTRAEAVTVTDDTIVAQDGEQSLEVSIEDAHLREQYAASDAGLPVGRCPGCEERLVRTSGRVVCPGCDKSYSLPTASTVLSTTCDDCGLPEFRVERGEAFDLCLDPDCDPLDARVQEQFDNVWDCPNCGGALRVLRRGGLLLGCENYPDCETGFSFPAGEHVDECNCGLPVFDTPSGRRCLDRACEQLGEI